MWHLLTLCNTCKKRCHAERSFEPQTLSSPRKKKHGFPFSNRPRLAIPLSEKMEGNLRPVNQEIDGGQGGDEAVQIGVESSESSGITGIEDKSRGSAEPEKNERAVILRFP